VLAEPLVAVIVAVPVATDVTKPVEVTRPVDDTVATVASDVAHVTVAPQILLPRASFTIGTNVAVSPTDTNNRLVGESVTLAAA
jgi:hypothetical protein